MWRRDPAVNAMVEWLDKGLPAKYSLSTEEWDSMDSAERLSLCSPSEVQAILEQMRDCRDDFSYAARNYFWITNKKKQEQLFSLWEGQYLILQKYYDLKSMGRPQKLMILKARQLGASRLIEAMIAWRAMFFPNTNAIVVSVDQEHSSFLFGYMLFVYDRMPWWLKPMCASRKEETGLLFENRDASMRGSHPGMNSRVMVQWSTQYSGVGQGIPVDCAHVSEFCNYADADLEAILNEDLGNSMADDPEVFGFVEGTGEGSGSAAHMIWRAAEKRMDQGKIPRWYPLFLPSFFESTRVLAPPQGWIIQHEEKVIKERIKREWLRCQNQSCGRFFKPGFIQVVGATCEVCRAGKLDSFTLSDSQLYWHQDRREDAESQGHKALKQFKQEMALTAEDAWQVSGYVMFNDSCRDWVAETIEEQPLKKGKIFRDNGEVHGAGMGGHCYVKGCHIDHRGDETPFWIWREPEPNAEYVIGVDVSEGIGQDYSVIFVNKVGRYGSPDEQVAIWRDNHTKPKELAYYANIVGRMYNEGMMCIEYNTYQTTGDDIIYVYQYPNIFRWKNKETINLMTHKWHWWTKVNTKAYLHQTGVDFLMSRAWIIRSANFLEEMKTYRKEEYDSRTFGADEGFRDDELMAGLISLYCTHELDCDPASGRVSVPEIRDMASGQTGARYQMNCTKCKTEWPSTDPEREWVCPGCGSPNHIKGVSLVTDVGRETVDLTILNLSPKDPKGASQADGPSRLFGFAGKEIPRTNGGQIDYGML